MYTEHLPHAGTPGLMSARQSAVTLGQRSGVRWRMSVWVFYTSSQAEEAPVSDAHPNPHPLPVQCSQPGFALKCCYDEPSRESQRDFDKTETGM